MAWVWLLLFCDADIERCNESEVGMGGLGAPLGKLGKVFINLSRVNRLGADTYV